MKKKLTLIAPAIKTNFWKEIYFNTVKQNDCDIALIFVGDVEPEFNLPENFHYINSDKTPTECADIALNKAFELEPDYIQNIADDCLYKEKYFDKLIEEYEKEIKKYEEDLPIICGSASYTPEGKKDIMAIFPSKNEANFSRALACKYAGGSENELGCDLEGPTLLVGNFSSIKTFKKLGKIDLDYKAIYWDCDLAMRIHSMGGKVIVFEEDKVPSVVERKNSSSRLYSIFGSSDFELLFKKWEIKSYDGKTWSVKRR